MDIFERGLERNDRRMLILISIKHTLVGLNYFAKVFKNFFIKWYFSFVFLDKLKMSYYYIINFTIFLLTLIYIFFDIIATIGSIEFLFLQ